MAVYFVDNSVLVKRYINELGSSWLDALLSQSSSEVLIAEITQVEVIAALTRRGRGTGMSPQTASQAINRFKTHVSSKYQIVFLGRTIINSAILQAESHALRGYDAVQLATALEVDAVTKASGLPTLTFTSADNELNKVALAAGLMVDNPNNHP